MPSGAPHIFFIQKGDKTKKNGIKRVASTESIPIDLKTSFQSKLSKKKDDKDTTRDGPDFAMDDSTLNPLQDEDSNDMPENLPLTDPTKLGRRQDLEEEEEEEGAEPLPELMGIDKAILYSIDRCGELGKGE